MTISFKDFMEDNLILFLEIAFDKKTDVDSIACEHYQDYLESIKDRDYDWSNSWRNYCSYKAFT